jgi:hypothetical protein
MKYHDITPLQSMMINIREDGQGEVWKLIEEIKNPFGRCQARKLFAKAIKKLNENNFSSDLDK